MEKYHWFVCYNFTNDSGSGFGSVEITTDIDIFILHQIRDLIKKNYNFKELVIMNWKRLEENQLAPKDTE